MSQHAIEVHNLSKRYYFAHLRPTFRELLNEAILSPFRSDDHFQQRKMLAANAEFWALRDVSCDVEHGEVLGVIGRNGSGKSTLLKIMSRIVVPTTGHIRLRGRVGSLLEVGTGFHPDLTGRENIFFNGAILGMSYARTRQNFDAIVEFSGTERFIDSPVKHYSSGMYVRLAFSVACHLDADILLLDEVLSVGDLEFYTKSQRKMFELAKSGRTVILVSHRMDSIRQLADRVLWLDGGQICAIGDPTTITQQYEARVKPAAVPIKTNEPTTTH